MVSIWILSLTVMLSPNLIMAQKWQWDDKGKRDPLKTEELPFKKQWGDPVADSKYFGPSDMEANPLEPGTVFGFDFEIEQFTNLYGVKGDMRYKVNSADNSMYFSGMDIENSSFIQSAIRGRAADDYEIHFAIRNSEGEMMVFAKHVEEGLVAFYVPVDDSQNIPIDQYLSQMQYLNNMKDSGDFNTENLVFYEGKVPQADGRDVQFSTYFDVVNPPFATSVPLMGFGVGILKDYHANRQRVLVVTKTEDMWLQLKSLEKLDATWLINTEEYRQTDLMGHTRAGKEDVQDFMAWYQAKHMEIETLRAQRDLCPRHQEGKECRDHYTERIKTIKEQIETRSDAMGRTFKIPD